MFSPRRYGDVEKGRSRVRALSLEPIQPFATPFPSCFHACFPFPLCSLIFSFAPVPTSKHVDNKSIFPRVPLQYCLTVPTAERGQLIHQLCYPFYPPSRSIVLIETASFPEHDVCDVMCKVFYTVFTHDR